MHSIRFLIYKLISNQPVKEFCTFTKPRFYNSQPLEHTVSMFNQFWNPHVILLYGPLNAVFLPLQYSDWKYFIQMKITVLCYKTRNSKQLTTFALTFSSLYFSKPMPDDADWPTYTKEHPKYYILNADRFGTGKGPRTTACVFWNDFLPRLKNHPGGLPRSRTHFQKSIVT